MVGGNGSQSPITFQSLGRDSVHSSGIRATRVDLAFDVSIPRSGFCSFKLEAPPGAQGPVAFQSLGRDSVHSSCQSIYSLRLGAPVSIPRSGFCSFKLRGTILLMGQAASFNPSVGILFIQAPLATEMAPAMTTVSIPRSGFCSFKQHPSPTQKMERGVSIPRSGFCSFKRSSATRSHRESPRFNPSVGILFIQAGEREMGCCGGGRFQSLGRDSVHSSMSSHKDRIRSQLVSIPRSGFCSFKLGARPGTMKSWYGFNPSVGILFIQA